jgi:ElaB/YqjD/DUF883 family membrane-anchored ribosome-binding protein
MNNGREAAEEIPKGWDGEPVIKFPVHYDHGFIIDADKQIVCNLLWHSHRVNYDVRDKAGQYIASSLNANHDSTAQIAALRSALEEIRQECADVREGVANGSPSIAGSPSVTEIVNSFAVIDDYAERVLANHSEDVLEMADPVREAATALVADARKMMDLAIKLSASARSGVTAQGDKPDWQEFSKQCKQTSITLFKSEAVFKTALEAK